MEWKDIVNSNLKYKKLIEIKEPILLKANIHTFLKKNIAGNILMVLVIFLILFITFHKNIKALGISILFILILGVLFIYFNSFWIKGKKKEMIMQSNSQRIKIPYANIKSVYVEERKTKIFWIPISSYYLTIMYESEAKQVTDVSFSCMFLDCQDTRKFLNHFIYEDIKTNDYAKNIAYKKKRILIKILIFLVLCAIITFSVFFL